MLRRLVLMVALSLAPRAHADARARRADLVLAKADRDLSRGKLRLAEQRLLQALGRDPSELRLLLRYAEVVLPLSGEPAADASAQVKHAQQFLERLARARLLAPDPELERQLLLHAAWAAALAARYDESFGVVIEAGRLQDGLTVACLRQIAALTAARDQLALAERALGMARQYLPQDVLLAGELGHVLLARGQAPAAVRAFAERFAVQPQVLEARRDLAYALAGAGRAREALALLAGERGACEADRVCALEAARIALEAGRADDALQYAGRLRGDANDLDALFVTADAHTRAGHFRDARQTYAQILRVRPDSARARQALEQLPPDP